jgi:branched-chain amino acid transport system ATP-binding protein
MTSATRPRPAATPPILELIDVHASYGRIEVLRGVDLVVPRGAVMALLGANGAGKTTLLRVISGLMPMTGGHIHLSGVHINDASPDELTRAGMTMVPEGRGVFPNLTVEENLWLSSYSGQRVEKILTDAYTRFPRLKERRRQLAGSLSGGEQQMLSLARALILTPKLLVADEMSLGLAPKMVDLVFDSLERARTQGVAVILIEQFVHRALAVADSCILLQRGTVGWSGPAAQAKQEVLARYLGEGAA